MTSSLAELKTHRIYYALFFELHFSCCKSSNVHAKRRGWLESGVRMGATKKRNADSETMRTPTAALPTLACCTARLIVPRNPSSRVVYESGIAGVECTSSASHSAKLQCIYGRSNKLIQIRQIIIYGWNSLNGSVHTIVPPVRFNSIQE